MPKFKVVFGRFVQVEKELIIEADNVGLALIRAGRQTDAWNYISHEEITAEEAQKEQES